MMRGALLAVAAAALVVGGGNPVAASESTRRAIVVPVQLSGYLPRRAEWQGELDEWMSDRLRMAQFDVDRSQALTSAETQCFERECLAAIAKQHNLSVVVAARLINDQQDLTTFHLAVKMFLSDAGGAPAFRERSDACTNCSLSTVRDRLVVLEGSALANTNAEPVEPKPSPTVPGQMPSAPIVVPIEPVAPLPARGMSPRVRWTLRGVGLGVAALGIGGLAWGGVERAHDGDHVDDHNNTGCGASCGFRLDTGKYQATFFALGAVGVVAGGALIVASWWPTKRVAVTPEVSPTAARLSLAVTF